MLTGLDGDLNQREWMWKTLEQMWETTGGVNNWQPGIALAGELTLRAITIQFPIAIASFIETVENVEAAATIDETTVLDGKVLELKPDCYNVKEAMLAEYGAAWAAEEEAAAAALADGLAKVQAQQDAKAQKKFEKEADEEEPTLVPIDTRRSLHLARWASSRSPSLVWRASRSRSMPHALAYSSHTTPALH